MSSTAATKSNAHIVARAHEIIAQWNAEEERAQEQMRKHYEWVDYMVEVERERRETLPCHHGTAFWPDRGQVCGSCEAEMQDEYESEQLTDADIMAAAMTQARRELEPVSKQADPWGSNPLSWTDAPF